MIARIAALAALALFAAPAAAQTSKPQPQAKPPAQTPQAQPSKPPEPEPDLAYGAFQRGRYITAFAEAMKRIEQKSDVKAMTLVAELYADGLGLRLARNLHRYTHGPYAGLFARRTEVATDGRMVVWDVRDLPDDLEAAGLYLLADALWTLALWAIVTGAIQRPDSAWRLAAVAALGAVSAVAVERVALADGRWTYNALMPIVPILDVGLWPVAQMTILPVITVWLARARPTRPPASDPTGRLA